MSILCLLPLPVRHYPALLNNVACSFGSACVHYYLFACTALIHYYLATAGAGGASSQQMGPGQEAGRCLPGKLGQCQEDWNTAAVPFGPRYWLVWGSVTWSRSKHRHDGYGTAHMGVRVLIDDTSHRRLYPPPPPFCCNNCLSNSGVRNLPLCR